MRRENDGDRKGSGRLDSVHAQRLTAYSLQPKHLCSYEKGIRVLVPCCQLEWSLLRYLGDFWLREFTFETAFCESVKEGIMKFLKLNMTNKTIQVQDVPQEYQGLGGRGLTSVMINAEVPATCDPLGPDNKLIFAPGLLSGTPLANTSRISIGAKSPLTGTIKESNAGGTVAAALGHLGITAVIVEGQPAKGELFLLRIDDQGNASLISAQEYKGMRTYALAEKLLTTYGEKTAVLCIGPAGEYKLSAASVQTTDIDGRPCRAAGRGGLGAVMGAKGLKAIIVDQRGKSPDSIADPEAFKEAAKAFAKAVTGHPFSGKMLPALGTAGLVSAVNSMGAFPSYNATKGVLEGWEKISGEAMAEVIQEKGRQDHSHGLCPVCGSLLQ